MKTHLTERSERKLYALSLTLPPAMYYVYVLKAPKTNRFKWCLSLVHSSADKTFYGKIVSHGNRYLRWALIEAVWPAIRKDLKLKLIYQKLRQRKNANIAKVAVARRLSTIVYRVLSENRTYIV